MTGAFAGAIGEGMGDTLATYFNANDRVGEYSTGNPIGIRTAPYTNYPHTYGDFNPNAGVHLNGEIYAATMWRLRELWIAKSGDTEATAETLHMYVVNGMNFTPARPAYEDMREGILDSISHGSGTVAQKTSAGCVVWDAFAHFGIGTAANGVETCFGGGAVCSYSVTESFAKPSECSGGGAGGLTLSARAYKVKGVRAVDLTWTGATGTNVDVKRGGTPLATTGNDGSYTDNVGGKGAGTFSYQVCNAGTTVCSNVVTAVF